MAKPFQKLRARLLEYDIEQADYARRIGKSPRWVSDRLNGHMPWDTDTIYQTMEMLDIAPDEMHIFFPRGGQNESGCLRMSARPQLKGA